MIDADASTVQGRLNQLDQALRDGGQQTVADTEGIARLIPKRNVETWILCLNGKAVNEDTDYKNEKNDWKELIPKGSETLCQWTRSQAKPPNHCVDSLWTGVRELKHLGF